MKHEETVVMTIALSYLVKITSEIIEAFKEKKNAIPLAVGANGVSPSFYIT